MKLWTIQPVEVWEEMQKTGCYICDPAKADLLSEDDGFVRGYNWLIKQMETKIGPRPNDVKYPVWAWHTRNWLHKKPDLRETGYGTRGRKCVCLEIEKPDEDVLLSDFDAWHAVLNKWYLDDSANEAEWELIHEWFDGLPIETKNRIKEESWQKIFDISPYQSDWRDNGRYVQATFWKLNLDEVKKVQYFTCR